MVRAENVFETNRMIVENKLDIRTITMGISLLDCSHPDLSTFCNNVYDKITKQAEHLVRVGEDLEATYGLPIVNKRVSITPVAIAANACRTDSYVPVAEALDKAAKTIGVNFIGGFTALVDNGFTKGDRTLINSIPAMAIDIETCRPKLGNVTGGLSGPAIKPVALRMVWLVAKAVKVPIVGIGGIMNATDALEFMLAGASAVQVGTASFINPGAAQTIAEDMAAWMFAQGETDIRNLIGALKV